MPVTRPIDLLANSRLDALVARIGTNQPGPDLAGVFSITNSVLRVSGEKSGFLFTRHEFSNYRLPAEFKWGDATFGTRTDQSRNSGIWVHSRMGLRASPEGCERQIRESDTGSLYLFPGTQGTVAGVAKTRPSQRFGRPALPDGTVKGYRPADEIETPHGEWNHFEVICSGRQLTIRVSGKQTVHAEGVDPSQGIIGIESANAEIMYRKLELLPLDDGGQK